MTFQCKLSALAKQQILHLTKSDFFYEFVFAPLPHGNEWINLKFIMVFCRTRDHQKNKVLQVDPKLNILTQFYILSLFI